MLVDLGFGYSMLLFEVNEHFEYFVYIYRGMINRFTDIMSFFFYYFSDSLFIKVIEHGYVIAN